MNLSKKVLDSLTGVKSSNKKPAFPTVGNIIGRGESNERNIEQKSEWDEYYTNYRSKKMFNCLPGSSLYQDSNMFMMSTTPPADLCEDRTGRNMQDQQQSLFHAAVPLPFPVFS